jgi:ribosomal protein S18 acetylase RimI-like enzyme
MPHGLPRQRMRAPLVHLPSDEVLGIRSPVPEDAPRLATLMLSSFLGTVDYEGENEDDAIAQVRSTLNGSSGAFNWSCSRVVERGAILASATLVTRWENLPFIVFTMTAPAFKRTGLARACMLDAMRALAGAGETEVRLVVTLANTPALALYESLGFIAER